MLQGLFKEIQQSWITLLFFKLLKPEIKLARLIDNIRDRSSGLFNYMIIPGFISLSKCTIKGDYIADSVLLHLCCTVHPLKENSHCSPWVSMGTPCQLIGPTWGEIYMRHQGNKRYSHSHDFSYLKLKYPIKLKDHDHKIFFHNTRRIPWNSPKHQSNLNFKRHVRFILQMISHKKPNRNHSVIDRNLWF